VVGGWEDDPAATLFELLAATSDELNEDDVLPACEPEMALGPVETTLVELIEDETALELEETPADTKEDEADVLAACEFDIEDEIVFELEATPVKLREDETDVLAACEFDTEDEIALEIVGISDDPREVETELLAGCELRFEEEE
jgi:hypothetical protein